MSNSPFKFLDSYTKEDKDIFFGRETEVEDIYTKIFQSKILLVHGASGTGKSSLISCGLGNKFQNTDWLPVSVRRGTNINDSLKQQLEKCMLTQLSAKGKVSLIKILKSVYLDHFKPIYLVFDQFEELFIFGDHEEWTQFVASVREVLDSDMQVKFVFIIRGEYLELLTEFESVLPEIFSNRIRIEKMTRTNAVNCITGPCHSFGIQIEEHFQENLLTKLSPSKTEIELTYLQVFLDRIFKKAGEKAKEGKIIFSNALLDELGNAGDVLSQFLDEQIELIPDSEKALALLKSFVTTDATKKQITSAQAAEFVKTIGQELSAKQVDSLIQELVNRRILKDKDEAGCYELRHDSIAAKVFEKITTYERDLIEVNQFIIYAFGEHEKRAFLLNESDLAYIAPYETKLNFSGNVREFIEKSKATVRKKNRSRKRIIATVAGISVMLVISVLAMVYAFVQQTVAVVQGRDALAQKELALIAQADAEQQKLEADRQAKIAQEQTTIALKQKQEAEKQQMEALRQKELVLTEMKRGDSLRVIGESEKRRADSLSFVFDTVFPAVVGPPVIFSGGFFSGQLFIAAATSGDKVNMFMNDQPLTVVTDPVTGIKFGEIKFVASAQTYNAEGISNQSFTTEIHLEGTKPLKRTFEYVVVNPTLRVTNGNAPTLYLNCGNRISIEIPALGASYNPNYKVTGGSIIKGDKPGNVTIIPVSEELVITVLNGGAVIGKEILHAKPVPNPHYVARGSNGVNIDLKNGIPGTDLTTLRVEAEPEENFKIEAPKDSKYEISSVEVILARGTQRVATINAISGIIDVSYWKDKVQPGDRIVVDIKNVTRLTYDGGREPVEVKNGVIIIPIH